MEEKIQIFLEETKSISTERYEIVRAIRNLFLEINPSFKEGFKYGGITYDLLDELIGGIYSYAEHVSIEFSHGADLSDIYNVLEGTGKYRRRIKIKNFTDIKSKPVSYYIEQFV